MKMLIDEWKVGTWKLKILEYYPYESIRSKIGIVANFDGGPWFMLKNLLCDIASEQTKLMTMSSDMTAHSGGKPPSWFDDNKIGFRVIDNDGREVVFIFYDGVFTICNDVVAKTVYKWK